MNQSYRTNLTEMILKTNLSAHSIKSLYIRPTIKDKITRFSLRSVNKQLLAPETKPMKICL